MRLADFLEQNTDRVLAEAASFAKTLPTLRNAPEETLRDHFLQCLETIVQDMRQSQSRTQAIAKSQGQGPKASGTTAAGEHGAARANSGLTTSQLVSEFRALRASVLRLWSDRQQADAHTVEDLMRFNEAIDQTLAESVARFEEQVEHWRHIFLGVVGHDLRTPLNAIALTSEMLRRRVPGELKPQTEILVKGTKRIGGMLDSLLDYSNSQIGSEMALNLASADLGEACAEEIALLQAANPEAEIGLRRGKELRGVFDVSRIREALSNLVANAIQHGAGQEVEVRLSRSARNFIVTVSNRGHIPAQQLDGIFEPLKRGGDYKTGHRTNLGLGLFICQQIASAHGGQIGVSSEDGGVNFRLAWPIGQDG